MDNWRKLQKLSWSEWSLLAQALLMLPLTKLGLRLIGFRRWQSVLASVAPIAAVPAANATSNSVGQAQLTVRMVRIAACYGPYRANCLSQSLTLWWLLRRRGIESDLRIGVRTEESRFQAHAWVERTGLVLNDTADVHHRFVPFDCTFMPVDLEVR